MQPVPVDLMPENRSSLTTYLLGMVEVEDILAAQMASTIFHPAGSAAMGPDSDPMAVLDERMRVRGVTGLRVVDTSAMPRVVSGNTNAPTIMMAEKGAAMILEDARN